MRLQLDSSTAGLSGLNGTAAAEAAGRSGRSSHSGGSESGDSSSVSGVSSLLGQLTADRSARIQQLTAAVQNGSYQVSGAAVSRAIVGQAIS